MKRHSKILLLSMLLVAVCFASGCGCGKKADDRKVMEVTGTYSIYEYDMETSTFGEEVTDKTLQYGRDYVFGFGLDFKDLKFFKSDVTLQLELGGLDDEINLDLYDYGTNEPEKNQFYRTEDGMWQIDFDISSKSVPDFSEAWFVLSVDSLQVDTDIIALSLSSEDYRFKINGLNEMQIPVKLAKGTFDFTAKNFQESGDFVLQVPERCTSVKVAIYEDEKYTKLCGEQTYGVEDFMGDALVVTISEDILVPLRTKQREEQPLTVYLRITAEGGSDFLSSTIDTTLVLD